MFEYKGRTIDTDSLTTQELEDLKQEMADTVHHLTCLLYAVTSDLKNRKNKVPIVEVVAWDSWDDQLFK